MGPLSLALDRTPGHPLCEAVRRAGWEPLSYACTERHPSQEPPPPGPWDAILILSPSGARAILPHLDPYTPCLVTGPGTAGILGGHPCLIPGQPDAEGLWRLLQERLPRGGKVLLVRGERSRGLLETRAAGSPWRLSPWVSHREAPLKPLPPLPDVRAVLALSPLQAELLAPLSRALLRFAWGERTAQAFAAAGCPVTAWCQPDPAALETLLRSL